MGLKLALYWVNLTKIIDRFLVIKTQKGKDLRTYGRVIVSVELVGAIDPHGQLNAECQYSLKNRKRRKHYMGKMNLRSFELGHYDEDASFENVVLRECGGYSSGGHQPIEVSISITQHPSSYVFIPAQPYVKSSSSTHSLNTICEDIGLISGGNTTNYGVSWAPSKSVSDLVAESLMINNRALVGLSHLAASEKPKLCHETLDLSKGLYRNHQDEFLRKKPSPAAVSYLYGQIW